MNPRTAVRIPDDTLLVAYIAGLFDGEGSICVNRPNGADSSSIGVWVTIAGTNVPLMEWLLANLGGRVDVSNREGKGWKEGRVWKVNGVHAATFLAAVLPFLIVKRAQAEAGIALIALRGQPGRKLAPDVVARLEALYWRIRSLNRKGATPLQHAVITE